MCDLVRIREKAYCMLQSPLSLSLSQLAVVLGYGPCEPSARRTYMFRPGCRHVSKALAVCLHESLEYARSMAIDKQRFNLLLALALSGYYQLPRQRDGATHGSSVVSIRDRETRENSLSCVRSAVEVIPSCLRTKRHFNQGILLFSRQKSRSSRCTRRGHFSNAVKRHGQRRADDLQLFSSTYFSV